MKMPRDLIDRVLLLFLIFSCSIPGLSPSSLSSSKIITLDSFQIFTTHEWLPIEPKIYFQCQGENKTLLPDVKRTYFIYTFHGEESWQPLTELPHKKCKRCGFYEQDTLKPADVFDEWELCPGDFVEGKYEHLKEHEFNATFICPECRESAGADQVHTSDHEVNTTDDERRDKNADISLITVVSVVVGSIALMVAIVASYKFWQKHKRQRDQARFLKLFEESDDIEDELGLGDVL